MPSVQIFGCLTFQTFAYFLLKVGIRWTNICQILIYPCLSLENWTELQTKPNKMCFWHTSEAYILLYLQVSAFTKLGQYLYNFFLQVTYIWSVYAYDKYFFFQNMANIYTHGNVCADTHSITICLFCNFYTGYEL